MQPLVIMFGPPDFGHDAEGDVLKSAWQDLFYTALKDFPPEAVEIAVAEWLRVGKPFFPKPSELFKLGEKISLEIRLIAFRLRRAVETAEPAPRPKRTPEDAQAVRAMIDNMRGPDGKIHLAKSTAELRPPVNDRAATAKALRRLSGL